MLFRTTICVLIAVAIILVAQTELHAKKGAAARAAAAATTATTTKAVKEGIDPRTGKARATRFEKGKPVDTAKTKGQVNKITQSTGDLAAALRAKSARTPPPPPPPPAKRKKSATTRPASQPAKPPPPPTDEAQ